MLDDNAIADTYRITSTTGRIYNRTMLLNAATRTSLARTLKISRAEIAAVIDDHNWIRPHYGEIPTYVANEAVLEAIVRRPKPQET